MNNFIVAYACRKIGVASFFAFLSRKLIGTRDDEAGAKSFNAGWDVAGGADYSNTVSNLVNDIWDKSDDKNRLLWPNPELLDNYVSRAVHMDPYSDATFDRNFSSPGFLELTDP